MGSRDKPIAVSMGDPCGIGPDIILRAAADGNKNALPSFIVHGCSETLKQRAEMLGIDTGLVGREIVVEQLASAPRSIPARANKSDARAAIEAIERSVEDTINGKTCAVVTCPINKKTLYDVGFNHPGHTEFLAELASRHLNGVHQSVMMIVGPDLKTVPVTIHIPIKDVPEALTQDAITSTIRIVATDLVARFAIKKPRIAVAGLNPHAGENGAIGAEDEAIIRPAVDILKTEGLDVSGPLPADTMFHAAARQHYDVAVCMYHDQALIPAKMLGFDDAVNVTLGLPFIRTSPDHGTAYDIAGTGKANPSSFVAALRLAARMAGQA